MLTWIVTPFFFLFGILALAWEALVRFVTRLAGSGRG